MIDMKVKKTLFLKMFVASAITTTKSINQKQSENSIEFELLFVSYRNN